MLIEEGTTTGFVTASWLQSGKTAPSIVKTLVIGARHTPLQPEGSIKDYKKGLKMALRSLKPLTSWIWYSRYQAIQSRSELKQIRIDVGR